MLDKSKNGSFIWGAGLCLLSAPTLFAQTLPNPGAVGRDMQLPVPSRSQSVILPTQMAPTTTASSAASASSSSDTKIFVRGYQFTGNKGIASDALALLTTEYSNKAMTLADLEEVAAKITRHYRKESYMVALAYLPPQQSGNGVVTIGILEGRYADVVINNSSSLSTEKARQIIETNLCASEPCNGRVIRTGDIERATLLLRDLPGVTASVNLAAGKEVGFSNLQVNIAPHRTSTVDVGADNYGSPAVGRFRISTGADFNNLNGQGDRLSLAASTAGKGFVVGSVGYNAPVGSSGTRLGVGVTRGQFHLVDSTYAGADGTGVSNTLSGYVTHPAVRTVNQSVYLRASLELRSTTLKLQNIEASGGKARVARVGLSGDKIDSFGGGGYTLYALTGSGGVTTPSDASKADDAATVNTAGRYGKLSYSLARQQALVGGLTLYGSLSGQTSTKNLDDSEKMGLGGPFGVRAYPGGEAAGSKAALGTLELRYTAPWSLSSDPQATLTYVLFADRGWSDPYKTFWPGHDNRVTRAIGGYGVGMTARSKDVSLRAMWGHTAGKDSASHIEPTTNSRLWLEAGLTF